MAEFIWREGDEILSHKTGSHSEDLEFIRKLSLEGKSFTYKKFGKAIRYPN